MPTENCLPVYSPENAAEFDQTALTGWEIPALGLLGNLASGLGTKGIEELLKKPEALFVCTVQSYFEVDNAISWAFRMTNYSASTACLLKAHVSKPKVDAFLFQSAKGAMSFGTVQSEGAVNAGSQGDYAPLAFPLSLNSGEAIDLKLICQKANAVGKSVGLVFQLLPLVSDKVLRVETTFARPSAFLKA